MFTLILTPLLLTLKVAILATVGALLVGIILAWLMTRYSFVGRDLVDVVLTLPLVMPPTVLGYYLLIMVGRKGPIGAWLQESFGISLIFSWQGAVLAAMVASLPLVFKSARTAFASVEQNCEDAARTLGASELAVFCRISLPLAWRGLLAGSMLAFARAMGEFGATLMVAGNMPGRTQTLSMAVYDAVQAGDDGLAHTLVLITSLVSAMILYGSGKLLQKEYS